jgi:hypothetical protein
MEEMAVQIELSRTVATRPRAAFETIADVLAWPHKMSSVLSIELVDRGPIKVGTRLRLTRLLFGRETTLNMEVATIERPHRLRFFVAHPEINYELDHLIDAIYGGGCRMTLIYRSRPHSDVGRALHPFLTPSMQILLRDELERDLAELASDVAASEGEKGASEAHSRGRR